MIDIEHKCDEGHCRNDVDGCYCQNHLDEMLEKAHKEGYDEGYKEGEESVTE